MCGRSVRRLFPMNFSSSFVPCGLAGVGDEFDRDGGHFFPVVLRICHHMKIHPGRLMLSLGSRLPFPTFAFGCAPILLGFPLPHPLSSTPDARHDQNFYLHPVKMRRKFAPR